MKVLNKELLHNVKVLKFVNFEKSTLLYLDYENEHREINFYSSFRDFEFHVERFGNEELSHEFFKLIGAKSFICLDDILKELDFLFLKRWVYHFIDNLVDMNQMFFFDENKNYKEVLEDGKLVFRFEIEDIERFEKYKEIIIKDNLDYTFIM